MENFLFVCLLLTAATYFCGNIYIFLWQKVIKDGDSIPTGFGFLLPFIPIVLSLNIGIWKESILSFWVIFIAGLIYAIDDFIGLRPSTRISIAFFFGAMLFWTTVPVYDFISLELFLLFILFGFISIVLTNVINFYDGADLNLASVVFLTGLILVIFSDANFLIFKNIGWILIAFSFGFGLINRVPLSLYLGDSGCFVIALIFLYFLSNYIHGINHPPEELIIILALPCFDVFYVMLIRLKNKHNMLSRNYLHLYQRIRIRFGGFVHTFPQIINVLAILIISNYIDLNMDKIWEILVLSISFTPIFYILCRFFFVEKNYFFDDGKSIER